MYKTRFFFFIGSLIFCTGAYKIYQEYSLIKNGVVTQGRVVEMSSWHAPRVSYHTQDGQEYRYVPPLGSDPPDEQIGDILSVVYNRDNPKKVRILRFQYTFILGWILACLGGTIMLYAGGAIYARRKMLEFALTHQSSSSLLEE